MEPVRRDPVTAKLEHAARAAREIAALLDELPMLSDPQDMAGALVGEIRERFKPDVAAVYIRGRDRFMIAANHGLSKTEAKMELALDHAILTELGSDPEALLIAPVDLARGLVSGIAGARTDALLVGPVTVEGRIVGLITVGRGDFNDEELDILDELSREAAPGLAIAELLARLGGRPNDED